MKILNINANNGANLGDALIAYALQQITRRLDCSIQQYEIASLLPAIEPSSKNLLTERIFFLIKRKLKLKLGFNLHRQIEVAVAESDLILIGGGQLMLPSFLDSILKVALLAKKYSKKVILFGVGAEKIADKKSEAILYELANLIEMSYVRDAKSVNCLTEFGINVYPDPIPDVVFGIHEEIKQLGKNLPKSELLLSPCDYSRIKFYASSPQSKEEYINWWLNEVKSRKATKLNFLVSVKNDRQICLEIQKKLKQEGTASEVIFPKNIQQYIKTINSHKEIISGRMHPLIVAQCNETTKIKVQVRNEKLAEFQKKNETNVKTVNTSCQQLENLLQRHIN